MSGSRLLSILSRAAATFVVAVVVCFLLLQAVPGDPLERLDSPNIPPEQAERNRRALGLDQPPLARLAKTLVSYMRGDLGVSFVHRVPVVQVLAAALPYTLLLGAVSLTLSYGAGLPVAVLVVALPDRWRRWIDRALLVFSTIPRFWLGVVLVLVFHGFAGWLPASHAFSPGGGGAFDVARHLVLPALTLALPSTAIVCRYQLAVMEEGLKELHVRAARAAGVGGVRLLTSYVLRPGMGPAIALIGLDLPVIVSGAIVVEVVFAWPGLGRLTAEAVLNSDYPLALAAGMLTACVVVTGRVAAEALATRLDPRQGSLERGA